MTEVTGARLLVEALEAEDVEAVFGLIGSHVTAIYDALLGAPRIRTIDARHEQGAAYMADGYARAPPAGPVCAW